jgi:hypothetical protein
VNFLQIDNNVILDIVPCDCVSNLIIAGTSHVGQGPKGDFKVFHSSSSTQKPIQIAKIAAILLEFSKTNKSQRQVLNPFVMAVPNKKLYDFLFLLTKVLPVSLMQVTSKLPIVGS